MKIYKGTKDRRREERPTGGNKRQKAGRKADGRHKGWYKKKVRAPNGAADLRRGNRI